MDVLPAKDLSREPADDFNFDMEDGPALFEVMKASLIESRGIGLAAPQLGVDRRVFIMGHYESPDDIVPVYNPEILEASADTLMYEEGCLSFPDLYVSVRRPRVIRVRYSTPEGIRNTIKFDGMSARIFLHEMDHLDGFVMTDRASRFHLDRARKNLKLLLRRRKRAEKKK
jgi:peptide deformylase